MKFKHPNDVQNNAQIIEFYTEGIADDEQGTERIILKAQTLIAAPEGKPSDAILAAKAILRFFEV